MGLRLWFARKLHRWLAREWCGWESPPGDHLVLRFGPQSREDSLPIYVAETDNDGYTFCVGYPDEWRFHCRAEDARRMAWFILWTWWVKGTWFGLRRQLWYWSVFVLMADLRRKVPLLSPPPPGSLGSLRR